MAGAWVCEPREPLEIGALEGALVLEEEVVHRPEARIAALREGLHRRLCREPGVLVEGQRPVPEHQPHVGSVGRREARHRRDGPGAERALEVAEGDDRHERVGGASARRAGDGNAVEGVLVEDACRGRSRLGLAHRGLDGVPKHPLVVARAATARAVRREARPRARELVVDHLGEALVRLSADERPAVHEERRRPRHPGLRGGARPRLGTRPVGALGHRAAEAPQVQPDGLGVGFEVRVGERVLVREEEIVHRPEAAVAELRERLAGGFRRLVGALVERQRHVPPHDPQIVPVLLP